MKIEVGKSYRTRDGQKATITHDLAGHPYCWAGLVDNIPEIEMWTEDGKFLEDMGNSGYDLVAPWEEEQPALKKQIEQLLAPVGSAPVLSRRDQFAMAAMTGLLANPAVETFQKGFVVGLTESALEHADAMIAALDQKEKAS